MSPGDIVDNVRDILKTSNSSHTIAFISDSAQSARVVEYTA